MSIVGVNTSRVELVYSGLLIPELYRVHFPFDVVRFAIDDRDQIQGPIAAALFDRLAFTGDPIPPDGSILLEVMCRAPQPGLCFQSALLVRCLLEEIPIETDTPTDQEPQPGPVFDMPAEDLPRVPGSTA